MLKQNDLAEFVGQIIDTFEDFLEERSIVLQNQERNEDESDAIIYGSDYGQLQDAINDILKNWEVVGPEDDKKNDYFGIVRWGDEDIRCALEERGYAQTQNNIDEVRCAVENNSYFTGSMIEAGWDCIYCAVDDCADDLEEEDD